MSHIQGSDYVGSMVVMEDGLPKKSEYRRFKIKGGQGNDDFAAMEQVLTRRLTAYLIERERSEEHTSELQSLMRLSYAVFCLKKKKINTLSNFPHNHTTPKQN